MISIVEILTPEIGVRNYRPLLACVVQAGFPSPADDHLDRDLDLNEHLIKHPAATYFLRVAGDSMTGAGIHNNDMLIVDRSIAPQDGNVVVAILDGELTVKRLRKRDGLIFLVAENPNYPALFPTAESEFTVWGVVQHVIHKV